MLAPQLWGIVMFVVTVVFEIEPDELDFFIGRVRRQARDSLDRETGCLRFDVCTCDKGGPRVLLYEIYADADAFAAHLASEHFRDFDRDVASATRSKDVSFWSRV